jgi:uncharacterized membrane protein
MANNEALPKYKDYLNKTFLEELSNKFWSTKGARFCADKRLLHISDLSVKAVSFFSAYLIIFGLLSVYQIANIPLINEKIVAFGSTALAVLLLVFSQMESVQDYKIRANNYHECALKIAALYNQLRIFKTLVESPTPEQIHDICVELSNKYQSILERYPNHESIDFKKFKLEQKDYYELSRWDIFTIEIKYYYKTGFWYHALIFTPPLIFILYFFLK